MNGHTNQVPKLDEIAVDVLLELFAWLDVPDILSLRGTCRMFNDISRMRAAWLGALSYQENILGQIVPFDRAIAGVSSAQLEQVLVKKARCDKNWNSEKPRPTTFRTTNPTKLSLDPRSVNYLELLPGGRWLILGTNEGLLSIWNLNSQENQLEFVVDSALLKARSLGRLQGKVFCSMHPDSHEPTFDFLFVASKTGDFAVMVVLPYRVTLHDNEATEPKVSVTELPKFKITGTASHGSLSGGMFAYQNHHVLALKSEIRVLGWRDCNESVLKICSIELASTQPDDITPSELLLLPRNQVLVASVKRMLICEVPGMLSLPSGTVQVPTQRCPVLWSFDCGSQRRPAPIISPSDIMVYHRPNIPLEITVWGLNGTEYLIQLPPDGRGDIQVRLFNRAPSRLEPRTRDAFVHGRRRALLLNRDGFKLDTIGTSLDSAAVERHIRDIISDPVWLMSAFDERSGRVCGVRGGTGSVLLLDILEFA